MPANAVVICLWVDACLPTVCVCVWCAQYFCSHEKRSVLVGSLLCRCGQRSLSHSPIMSSSDVVIPGVFTASQREALRTWWKKVTATYPKASSFKTMEVPVVGMSLFYLFSIHTYESIYLFYAYTYTHIHILSLSLSLFKHMISSHRMANHVLQSTLSLYNHVGKGVFGVPLAESIQYAHATISYIDDRTSKQCFGRIPIVVAKCGSFLKEEGKLLSFVLP